MAHSPLYHVGLNVPPLGCPASVSNCLCLSLPLDRLRDLRSKHRSGPRLTGIRECLLNSTKWEADQAGTSLWHKIVGMGVSVVLQGTGTFSHMVGPLGCCFQNLGCLGHCLKFHPQNGRPKASPPYFPQHTYSHRVHMFTLLDSYHGLSTLVHLFLSSTF